MKIDSTKQVIGINSETKTKPQAQKRQDEANKAVLENQRDEQVKPREVKPIDLKATFAVTEDKDVVIRFLNEKGEVVKQIPPEELLETAKRLKETIQNFFSKKV